MKYIDKLLQGAEVEWTTLGDTRFIEIANNNRKPVKSSNRTIGNIPYYGANNIQDYVNGYTHNGTYILVAEDGTASVENYSIQWAVGKFWANNHVHVLREVGFIESRFIFHYLRTVNFIPFLTGGERAKLTKRKLQEIPIPILCPNNPTKSLEIQRKLVEILDKFTELEAELEAELDCRKRQYEYYRNKLLSFDMLNEGGGKRLNNVTIKMLGEIVNIKNGKDWKHLKEGSIPIYGSGGIMGYVDKASYNEPSVLIPRKGSINNLFYVDKPFWNVDTIFYTVIDKEQILPKFLFYFLCNYNIGQLSTNSTRPSLTQSILAKIKIPIPPLSEQQRIVSFLDKFDTLTSSISEGLPKEIELRRKQYEYYREQLLSFRH
jgi:putative type I restriction enzyme specificity protein HI_0216